MKTFFTLFLSGWLCSLLFVGSGLAQDSTKTHIGQGRFFVDKNGDGYNDNAPDDDGDGIPNGLDPDWQKRHKRKGKPNRFIDLNGDGINDVLKISNLESLKYCQIEIFNRWGKTVYISYDYKNNWDGEGVADGVYYYSVFYESWFGKGEIRGFIYVIR
jgi:gliding motility-associated-like protein